MRAPLEILDGQRSSLRARSADPLGEEAGAPPRPQDAANPGPLPEGRPGPDRDAPAKVPELRLPHQRPVERARPGPARAGLEPPPRPGDAGGERRGQPEPLRPGPPAPRGGGARAGAPLARPDPGGASGVDGFAQAAGWRPAFDDPQHEQQILLTLAARHALCPRCGFDLIDQKRPDCPECAWLIDPARLRFPDAPPRPGYAPMLAAALASLWLGLLFVALAQNTLGLALALPALFAAQLGATWKLLGHAFDPGAFAKLPADKRRPHWLAAGSALALGVIGTIGGFLLWTLV